MVQQDYRVIADRDKGDNPSIADVRRDDRVTYVEEAYGRQQIIRIERPVRVDNPMRTVR